MDRKFTPARQVLNLAYEALQHGNKHEARYWAQIAASMTPNMEDPWLILAAVATPRARIAYLDKALEINPNNQRAREDLVLTYQQINQKIKADQAEKGDKLLPVCDASPIQDAFSCPVFHPGAGDGVGRGTGRVPDRSLGRPPRNEFPGAGSRPQQPRRLAGKAYPTLVSGRIRTTHRSAYTNGDIYFDRDPLAHSFPDCHTHTPADSDFYTHGNPLSHSATDEHPTLTATTPATNTAQPPAGQAETVVVPPQPPVSGEKLILVSISEQHVYAYQGGNLIYSFVASTGVDNSTDTGTYTILDKLPDPYSYAWGFWMPDWMGIYYAGDLEDGFHALPLLANGERLWGDDLGTPASYGCIVLGVQDAQQLYDWADVGTTVQINP